MADFTLHVTLAGLCLYVPEPGEADPEFGRLHVLMPKTPLTHQHVPRLFYNPAATSPGKPPSPKWVDRPMMGRVRFGPSGAFRAQIDIPATLPDLNPRANAALTRTDLPGGSTYRGDAAVVFTSGGPLRTLRSACWCFGGKPHALAYQLGWEMTLSGERLELDLGDPKGKLTLHPFDGRLDLHVWHAPSGETPTRANNRRIENSTEATHFTHLYDLYGSPKKRPPPYFCGFECDEPKCRDCTAHPSGAKKAGGPSGRRASSYSCMGASARIT